MSPDSKTLLPLPRLLVNRRHDFMARLRDQGITRSDFPKASTLANNVTLFYFLPDWNAYSRSLPSLSMSKTMEFYNDMLIVAGINFCDYLGRRGMVNEWAEEIAAVSARIGLSAGAFATRAQRLRGAESTNANRRAAMAAFVACAKAIADQAKMKGEKPSVKELHAMAEKQFGGKAPSLTAFYPHAKSLL
jgi:hypothetical protein